MIFIIICNNVKLHSNSGNNNRNLKKFVMKKIINEDEIEENKNDEDK